MKSIFDAGTRDEVIGRISALTSSCKPQWGKMSVEQMIRHCSVCEEYYFGNIKVNRSFIGRIIGKIAIKGILKDENSTFKRNAPTSSRFIVTENIHNLEEEKVKWKSLIERYATFSQQEFTHWFFGRLTKNQLGQFIYKHCDHHLKQFGV